ncbi:MAG TPA: hypothetical protein VHI78_05200 [Bacteroidales bacterium]|jgi:hypothetical protein|nr:hypothetical protein [Bacteroidales bacterium]
MNLKPALFLAALIIIINNLNCTAQNPDTARMFRIETTDGNIYTGSIVSEDQNILVLRTERLGELRIQHADIKSRTELKEFSRIGGKIWLPNPQSSRYFWAPNGYGLEKSTGYYQNIWVLYNQFSVGISNNFSMGAGLLPLFLFAGTPSPVWIVPKFSIPLSKDKVNIGTGALLGTFVGAETGVFGLLYETTTIGSRDKNFSLGLAYGFARNSWMGRPIINFSGMIRIGPKGYLITENYLIPYVDYPNEKNYATIISLGGRSIIGSVVLDYSLWIPLNTETNSFIAVPFLGITVPLHGRKTVK